MKSICLVVQNYYEIDIRVRRKAEALFSSGYKVDVLALRSRGGLKRYQLNGVNVYTVSLGKKRGSLFRYAWEYFAFFVWVMVKLTILTRENRYAVIDVNTLPDFLIFAAVFARSMGAKLILDMHEITPEFYISKYRIKAGSIPVRIMRILERWSFNYADQVITINTPIEDLLISRGLAPGKSTIITNAADEERFSGFAQRSTPKLNPEKFIMMYHGTLTDLYGLDLAVKALAIGKPELHNAELWILGEGPESARLKELAAELGVAPMVKLIGLVSPKDVPEWLSKCDVGILPIRRDVFLEFASPNKLAEYIVMGKAVIISRLRAIRHYFSERSLAFFEPNDPVDLAQQMVKLSRNAELRRTLACQARVEYAPIRWEVMRKRYLELIERASGPTNNSPASKELQPSH